MTERVEVHVSHWRREIDDGSVNGDAGLDFIIVIGIDRTARVVVIVVVVIVVGGSVVAIDLVCLGDLGCQLLIADAEFVTCFLIACMALILTAND